MWFKNLQVYRLPALWEMTAEKLESSLAPHTFQPGTSLDLQSVGWASPRENGQLVHTVNKQMLIMLGTEKKLLPSSVVNQVCKAKAAEIEDQQGFKPGRKQMKELKEQVTDELLPRAFSIRSNTFAWIDPVNGWLVVDAGSSAKADAVLKLLLKSVEQLPLQSLRVKLSPIACATDWLAADTAPAGFTVDQDTELRSSSESKATVRYVRHTLEADDMARHIAAGKQCTRLAMTWNDRISFVLTETLAIKRVAPLDVIKENAGAGTVNEQERFDADFALMTGEVNKMLADLIEALGGEANDQADLVQDQASEAGSVHAAAAALNKTLAQDGVSATLSYGGKSITFGESAPDPMYDEAVTIVRNADRASISLVQRHLQIGYNRAARLLEAMEAKGVVSAMQPNGSRTVLVAA